MGENITFIIPNRGGEHIEFVVGQLRKLYPKSEYIVVTQDDDKPFMRGQLFNIGFNYANNEYLCFIDNDIFFKDYVDFIKIYNTKKCIVMQPLSRLYQVTLTDKSYQVTSFRDLGPSSKGGCTFISKNNFKKINGMSNLYVGWGWEDNELDKRGNILRIRHDGYHITHEKRAHVDENNSKLNHQYFIDRNKRDAKLDGLANTIFSVVSVTENNNIKFVNVNCITVDTNFQYQELLNKHFN